MRSGPNLLAGADVNGCDTAASANLLLPDRFAVVIGIESVNNGRLVPRKEDPLAVFGFDEDGRCAKVVVRRISGTHGRIASTTAAVPHIEIGHLTNPAEFPRLHVHGDNGIGGLD